ncbi:MAG: transglutaminase-like domain-containing protein [Oscillospiraceae bacterium]
MITTAKKELLPILLTVSLVMTTSYLFNPDIIYLLGAIAFVTCAFLFSFFRYIRTLNKLAPVIYVLSLIAVSFFSLLLIAKGRYSEDIGIFEFIYLPYEQGVRSPLYSSLIFMLSCYAYSSFIYYFTSVVYRQSVVFMIILIPCVAYAKKLEQIPFPLLVLMAALYICVMIHCKQLYLMKNINVVMDSSYKKSLSIFILITVITASIIPKPELTPFSGVIDNLSNINIIPSQKIGNFTSYSMDNIYNNYLSDKILFYVEADEPLYLKKQVFDLYDSNRWGVYTKNNFDYGYKSWEENARNDDFSLFMKNVAAAVKADSEFALRYSFDENFSGYDIASAEKSARIIGYDFRPAVYLTPLGICYLSVESTYKTENGEIFDDQTVDLSSGGGYFLKYFSQREYIGEMSDFSGHFTAESYIDFLYDLKTVIDNNGLYDGGFYQALTFEISEYENARSYYENTYELYSSRLRSLALDITGDCESDLEKALAIQDYFVENDFEYSLSFIPPSGSEGAEYFVFTSKKGSCSDYASAMVLMAREAGLPARYVEGFIAREVGDDGRYVVRELNSHAYPEVYISGMGWPAFEPTVSANSAADKSEDDKTLLTSKNITIGILILAGILTLVYILLSSRLKELVFRVSLKFKGKRKNAVLFSRLKKIAAEKHGLSPDTLSIGETKRLVYDGFGIDISAFAKSFEKMCYKDEKASSKGFKENYSLYKAVYSAAK